MATAAAGFLDWTEKHRPRKLADLVGNSKAVEEMVEWAKEWDAGPPSERALILAGEPGVGKTSAALAMARDLGWGVVEMNASDQRNEDVIRRIAGAGAQNRAFSLDGSFSRESGGRQLVLLDEADNLFGREDRGGMKAILDTIREARQPIVLIANDLYELQRRGAALKGLARTVKFTKVHSRSIPPALRRIAQAEGVELAPGVAEALAQRAGGDLRSAVNDLQAVALGRDHVDIAHIEALGARDATGDVWGLLGKVFYGTDADAARRAAWDLDETPETLALWIDENLPLFYTDRADLVDGYAMLSRADVYLGRVTRRQQYGLWSYASELMTAGVTAVRRGEVARVRFAFPSWLRKQSSSRAVRELRDRTAGRIGDGLHMSRSRVRADMFPYLRVLLQEDDFAAWAAWRFSLQPDELAFLLEEKSTSPRIKQLIALGEERYSVPFRELDGGTRRNAPDAEQLEPASAADDDDDDAPITADEDDDADDAGADAGARAPAASTQRKLTDAPPKAASDADAKKKQKNLFEF